MPKVTFRQGSATDQHLFLDDEEIQDCIRSVTITADAGKMPVVELDVVAVEVEAIVPGQENEIRVPQATTDLLTRYGWTPPPDHVAAKSYTSEELLADPDFHLAAREVTQHSLAAAFTEWDRRYREEPERFMSEASHLLKHTPETYGEAAAPYLLMILAEQSNGQEN
jgi:hypothetical protein